MDHNSTLTPQHANIENSNNNRFQWVSSIGNGIQTLIIWGAIVFFAGTGLLSLLITTTMPEYTYKVYFDTGNWWLVLIASLICILVLALLDHASILQKINTRILSSILAWYAVLFGAAWALIANVWPEWDPLYVLKAAQFARKADLVITCPGDEVSWILCPGGYLERFPYQIPLVFFDKILIFIFGDQAYLAFELINALCVAAIFVLVGKLADAIFSNARYTNASLLLCFAFLPLIFYVTFAYGNMLSLPFALTALLLQIKYFKNHKIIYAIGAVIFVLVGILFKSTMIYVLAAMIVVWFVEALREKKLKNILCIIISLALYPSVGLVTSATAHYFDLNPNIGEPKTVWIAMGLQKPSAAMPNNYGWYNGYPLKWTPEEYNLDQIEKESKSSIKESLQYFFDNPKYAWTFFSQKFISEWTDPLYESLLASNWASPGTGRPIMKERSLTHVQSFIYNGKGRDIILTITDILQLLLLFGTVISLFDNRKSIRTTSLNLAIIPVGMALLYLIWEAQSQYIMPAYVMMIPYAGNGLLIFGNKFVSFFLKK